MNEPIFVSEIERIDWLNEQAWQRRVSDSNQSFALSKQAIDLAAEINYKKGKAEALRTFGFCHIRLSRNYEALELLQQALTAFEEQQDIRNQSVVHEYFGIIYRNLGKYETSLAHLFESLAFSQASQYSQQETLTYYHLSTTYKYLGDLTNALEYAIKGLSIARNINDVVPESYNLNCIGGVYYEMKQYDEALEYFQQSLVLRQKIGDNWGVAGCYDNIGNIYLQKKAYQEALHYCLKGLELTTTIGDQKGRGNTLFNCAKIYADTNDFVNALAYCQQSLEIRQKIDDKKGQAEIYDFLGGLYNNPAFDKANHEQALHYLHQALSLAEQIEAKDSICKVHYSLSKIHKVLGNYAKALLHFEHYTTLDKEINNDTINQRIVNLQITHRVEQSQKEAEIYRLKNVELVSLIEEIQTQKQQVESTLVQLKTTQDQLIQKEKLASLGELTAGIAHEIQNPLNFVNNFAELSLELVDEMKEELTVGRSDDVMEIASTVQHNLDKINYHGKRASSIVKKMLEHSQVGNGTVQATDINALIGEYLRLIHRSVRTNYKDISVNWKTHFDTELPLIEVNAQEIGRVFMNLIDNAVYSVHEKKNQLSTIYEPEIYISTRGVGQFIELTIKDNGLGIAQEIRHKVFQPFFTTKPTGKGVGLGLSLAFDIITKGYNGKIEIHSSEGVGVEITLLLPHRS
ncbi:MAG: tetratricopeptide repeat protein [Spirosomataceae bacterium]